MTSARRIALVPFATFWIGAALPVAPARAALPAGTLADTAWARCGTPVSTGAGERTGVVTLADGAGGLFVLWQRIDPVSLHSDLYAQHLDADGNVVAGWGANGLALCTAPGDQADLVAVPEPTSGFLAAWADDRADSAGRTNPDIFALRVGAGGSTFAGWNAGGSKMTSSSLAQQHPAIGSDGGAGAFIAWEQPSSGPPPGIDIVLQHVMGDGSFAPGWPDTGIVIATGSGARGSPTVVPDDAGGALVAWYDARGGKNDIYAQRVAGDGTALWAANGVLACGGTRSEFTPRGVRDGAGGMFLAIQELTVGDFSSVDVIAQRIDGSGARPAGWPGGGNAVCTAPAPQVNHRIAFDGAGGAFFGWDDFRGSSSQVFALHLLSDGTIAPGWNLNGNLAGDDSVEQSEADLIADGAGGAILAWTESGSSVVIQRLTAAGAPAIGWTSSGLAICADQTQFTPVLASDSQTGAIVTCFDTRSGSAAELYASHVAQDARVPALLALSSVRATPQLVSFAWFGAPAGEPAELRRLREREAWTLVATPLADGTGFVRYEDRDVRPGETLRYRLSQPGSPAPAVETLVQVPAAAAFSIASLGPNPSSGEFAVTLASDRAGSAQIELLDVTGRRVLSRPAELAAGATRVGFGTERPLAPGVYTVRVAFGSRVVAARLCVVR
jgi:hypothetical protein